MQYPIKIKFNKETLESFMNSECGLWEDSLNDDSIEGPFVYEIADRHKTILEIRDADEAAAVYWALCSGTFQIYHYTKADRVCDVLKPIVREHDPKLLELWRGPSGM